MPVSPQDFALWSNLTGNPYPQTPAERMALAPQVYEFNRNLGRSGGPIMSPARRAVDVVGKAALAAGALAGAAYLGTKFGNLGLDDEPGITAEPPIGEGGMDSQVIQASGDITPPTTSDRFGQDVIANQTSAVQSARGLSSFKPTTSPIEKKPATQSEVIGSQQHFSPGTEEEMLGQNAAERAAAFRKSRAYSVMQKQYPGLREPSEELVGIPGAAEESVVITEPVRQPATIRVAKPVVVEEESPIAEMVTTKAAPAAVLTGTRGGPSAEAIREMDNLLARTHARHTPEQRIDIRNKYFASKYSAAPAETIVTETQPTPVRVAVEAAPRTARVKANEFLSRMSQEQGPLETYAIDPERSKAVSGLAFYPGGEIGVQMNRRKGGPTEYAYATADPYRLALSDYAQEGFPEGMGNIGGIVADKALAHQMGLQQSVERGGTIRQERQPIYTGLMSDADIMSAGMGKSGSTRSRAMEQAERHFETKNIMQVLEERAAARRQGII
jgi:hypothetical protein